MAHVIPVERAKGTRYVVRWRQGGAFRQRTMTNKRDAERFAARVETDRANGTTTAPLAARGKTVAEVVAASLAASRPRLKAGTAAGYEHLYAQRILPRFGRQRIASVTSEAVEAWVGELVAAGKAPSTVRNHYVALHKVFRYALRHRLITHDPCAAVQIPKPGNTADFAPVFLTAEQVEAIAGELDEHAPYGTVVRLAAYTGLRAAEIAGMRVRDVNLAATSRSGRPSAA